MKRLFKIAILGLAAVALSMAVSGPNPARGLKAAPVDDEEKLPAKTPLAWTLDEALDQWKLSPRDPYLQYVVLQLARRDNRLEEIAGQVEGQLDEHRQRAAERHQQIDLFSLFTGALAMQESLQLDTMRGDPLRRARAGDAAALEKRRKDRVDLASLKGPETQSHPWEKMLGGKKPAVSPLAKDVPEDFYLAEFNSLDKLLQVMELGDQLGNYLVSQAFQDARTQQVSDRLKAQLALYPDPLTRPFYDEVVEGVAITGSDLFIREGSDVTLLFQLKQPELFKARMDEFLDQAEQDHPGAKRSTGEYNGVSYTQVASPDRTVNVFSAYPTSELHVRGNSLVALQRVLDSIKGKGPKGEAVRRLGDSPEYAYVRTLMPRGAKEEDGFIYLSDPFIRHLVGPQLKLTERRRVLCYNNLRMIGHAALLYRTEFGQAPKSLVALAKTKCTPGLFGEDVLACPEGGKYTLSPDGRFAMCARHGHVLALNPCCEIPATQINGEEEDEYKAFLDDYNKFWKTYFDPIAIRIQVDPQHYRLETIILPLIDKSIYTEMAKIFGGKPVPLDTLPIPKGNILTLAAHLNKDELLKNLPMEIDSDMLKEVGIAEKDARKIVALHYKDFLDKGLGSEVGLHLYDATPMLDLNLPSAIGQAMSGFNTETTGDAIMGAIAAACVLLDYPVYLSIPVQDVKIVDQFLDDLDQLLPILARATPPEQIPLSTKADFYHLKLKGNVKARTAGWRIGPLKLRFFYARIGNGLYLAGKPFILEDLVTAEEARAAAPAAKPAEPDLVGTALFRLHPQNWNLVLPEYRLSWAENNREACLNNLGPMANVSRALRASGAKEVAKTTAEIRRQADELYGVHFFCPDGGKYELSPDGKVCHCTTHGSLTDPQQALAPDDKSAIHQLLGQVGGMSGALTLSEEGLRGVVTIERK